MTAKQALYWRDATVGFFLVVGASAAIFLASGRPLDDVAKLAIIALVLGVWLGGYASGRIR